MAPAVARVLAAHANQPPPPPKSLSATQAVPRRGTQPCKWHHRPAHHITYSRRTGAFQLRNALDEINGEQQLETALLVLPRCMKIVLSRKENLLLLLRCSARPALPDAVRDVESLVSL